MRSGARRGRQALTLVELLVAMFIIAILITLVVQVARYVYEEAARKETQSIQNLTMRAVEAYHELTGEYPPDDPNDFPPGTVTRLTSRRAWANSSNHISTRLAATTSKVSFS